MSPTAPWKVGPDGFYGSSDWADELPVLFLEEIVRPPFHTEQQETGFDQRRFRPLAERKKQTSIAVFEKLLRPQKVAA